MSAIAPPVLVTGDAVALDLRPASFASRVLSFLIDGATQVAILIGASIAMVWAAAQLGLDGTWIAAGLVVTPILAFVVYPIGCEQIWDGRSLGRWVLGTRVVRDDGGPVQLRQSILRAVMAMLEIWALSGLLALMSSLVDARGRRIGDLLAGTFVVQERMRVDIPPALTVPAGLEEWAASADIGRIDPILAAEARAFLARSHDLHPASRTRIGHGLVQALLPVVAPPPPRATDPEQFLTAVLAARSARERRRLTRSERRIDELAARAAAPVFVGAAPGTSEATSGAASAASASARQD